MRPVLLEIPLPHWRLPVGPALLVLALAALALSWFGYRRRAVDLATLGLVGAAGSLAFAFLYWGRSFTPTSLPVMSYGAMLATSLALGWVLTQRLARRAGLERDATAHAYVVAAIAGVVGARLLYVVTNPGELHDPIAAIGVGAGGLVAYGGFAGGFAGSFFALRRLRVPFLPWADAAAPSVVLGLGLTRLGCYLYGCDFGRPLTSGAPLASLGTFPRWAEGSLAGSGSPAFVEHVVRRGLSPLAPESLPVHPTQLYEASLGLGLFGLSLALFSRRRRHGQIFAWLALAYGAGRFVIEFFRDDPERGHFGPLALGLVWAGVGFAIVSLSIALALIPRLERSAVVPAILLAGGAVLVTWLARATAFAGEASVALSTSQWLGLATALAAGVSLRRLTQENDVGVSSSVPRSS